jgi:hypothetical protein
MSFKFDWINKEYRIVGTNLTDKKDRKVFQLGQEAEAAKWLKKDEDRVFIHSRSFKAHVASISEAAIKTKGKNKTKMRSLRLYGLPDEKGHMPTIGGNMWESNYLRLIADHESLENFYDKVEDEELRLLGSSQVSKDVETGVVYSSRWVGGIEAGDGANASAEITEAVEKSLNDMEKALQGDLVKEGAE